jgi:regulator of RNase E activity RraA
VTELSPATREALLRVGTSTLTGILSRRGLRNMFMQEVWPIRPDMPRMVGPASTMRFIPAREDKTATGRGPVQQRAMEECPPGHVLVVDARGDPRAASAGDIYCGRLKARGCAGIVTDAEEALATTLYDEFAEEEVARGRSLVGLFPGAGEEAKRDFEVWKGKRSSAD